MKKVAVRILAGIVIIVVLFSPYLLIDNFDKNAPFVFLVWFISVGYYLILRKRVQVWLDSKNEAEKKEGL